LRSLRRRRSPCGHHRVVFRERQFRMHQEGAEAAKHEQAHRHQERQVPVAGDVDDVARHQRRDDRSRGEPVFIRPAAVPEYFGAMSIGIDHIGPMQISEKKNPPDRHSATTVMSCHEQDRNQRRQRAGKAQDRDAQPREADMPVSSGCRRT